MSKAHNTELQRVAAMARRISESPAWSKILDSTERRVRFEDGFIQGWFARNINAKPAPKYREATQAEIGQAGSSYHYAKPITLYVKRIPAKRKP
jgi:hypothetical protein